MTISLNTEEISQAVNEFVKAKFGEADYGVATLLICPRGECEWYYANDNEIKANVKVFGDGDEAEAEEPTEASA